MQMTTHALGLCVFKIQGFVFVLFKQAITIFLFFGVVLGPYGTNVVNADDSKKLMWCVCPPPFVISLNRTHTTHTPSSTQHTRTGPAHHSPPWHQYSQRRRLKEARVVR